MRLSKQPYIKTNHVQQWDEEVYIKDANPGNWHFSGYTSRGGVCIARDLVFTYRVSIGFIKANRLKGRVNGMMDQVSLVRS